MFCFIMACNMPRQMLLPVVMVMVMPNEDGSLSSTVYRKPTYTDLYLQWDSHHTLPSKYSVIGSLLHRAKTISSNPNC